jgi:hypothetical protein
MWWLARVSADWALSRASWLNVKSRSHYILPMSTLIGLPLSPSLRLLREWLQITLVTHPPRYPGWGIGNWLVRMTSQPNLIVSLPWDEPSTFWQSSLLLDGYQGMPHNEHNVIPFYNRINDSNGRMRYLSLSLSLWMEMVWDFVDQKKSTLTPCS